VTETLQAYFKQVGKTKLLTREDEVMLSQRIEKGDQRARDRMIRANLRLAISIAKKYQNRGCALEDLIQESSIGLVKAVDRFDWRKGFKFSTYACWWIKQAVRRHIASHSSSIRLPSYAKSIMWKIKQTKIDYEEEFGCAPTNEELADLLGVSQDTLESVLRCSSTPVSLDKSLRYKSAEIGRTLSDIVPDENYKMPDVALDEQKITEIVRASLSSLTSREEKIMRMRFGITENDNDHINFPITNKEKKKLGVR
jgi:RNA polymerase primary sigma factor